MLNWFIAFQVFGIAVMFIAQALLLHGDGSREQKLMSLFISGSICQNGAYLLELTAKTRDVAIASTKMQYLGSAFIALCFCHFMYTYCNIKAPERLLRLIGYMGLGLLVLVFTCESNTLFYKEIGWVEGDGERPYLLFIYGPAHTIFLIVCCVIPFLLSLFVLLRTILTSKRQETGRKYKCFFGLTFLPFIALMAYTFRLTRSYDATPVVTGVTLSLVVILVWSRQNYDFSKMAADVVLHNMADGVIMLDAQKRIVSYNSTAAEIFTELSFQTSEDSIEDMEDFPEDVLNSTTRKEFGLNNRFYESHVKQISDKNGVSQGYVILVMDVTETRNYIEEIKKVREQAENANKAKSEFLANMSHEIRTPMNAVMGLSDIIMEESRGRKVYGYACDIKSAAQNLLTIINDILDLSKVEAGKMELVTSDYYIKNLVGDVVNMMDVAASQRGLMLTYEYDEYIPCQYHGDEGRIKQILINLLSNALKFTQKGYVKVTVGGQPGDEPEMEMLSIRIEDTGCGIRQENLEKIFEDFRQVDSKQNRGVEGTGLGLSITKQLVRLMKGTIEVESVFGQGTIFTVKLPQKIVDSRTLMEMPEAPKREAIEVKDFVVDNYKVLVVDDNLINRKVAVGFLKNYNFELTEADSGPAAIALVKQTRFNMIFMDHMMPGMDGIEAVRIIREECGPNGRTPIVVALTANAMEGVKENFLKNGFQDYISKPLDRKSLNVVLAKWIPASYQRARNAENKDGDTVEHIQFEDINISGVDIVEAQKHHTGGAEDFLELLRLYCMDGKRKCTLLRALVENRDYINYGIEVHGLKSASANVGAMELSGQAKEHEGAAKREDMEFIHRHYEDLLACYAEQIRAIEKFLDNRDSRLAENEGESDMALENSVLVAQLREAVEELENFHSKDCAKVVESLMKYQIDEYIENDLKEIREQLKMYEDDEAERLLHRLIDRIEKED